MILEDPKYSYWTQKYVPFLKNRVNKENWKKWIDALRSGKYKQGTGFLYDDIDDSYCCLGVCTSIFDPEYMENGEMETDRCSDKTSIELVGESCSILGWEEELASLNDGGTSFYEIAALLEEVIK